MYDDHRPDTARQDESTILPATDGIHNEGLDLEAIQASRNHDPNDRDHAPPLLKTMRQSMIWAATNSRTMP
jgi:hypothetical protein